MSGVRPEMPELLSFPAAMREWTAFTGDAGPERDLIRGVGAAVGRRLLFAYVFGSRVADSAPARESALDLVLVVDNDLEFYREMKRAHLASRSPRLLAALNRRLAPNVLHYVAREAGPRENAASRGRHAKLVVITETDLAASLALWAPDHFMLGRFSQRVVITGARSETERARAHAYLALAIRRSIDWAGPYMPPRFTAVEFCRHMLEISYRAEIRPESPDRVGEVFLAQQNFFREVYGALFRDEEARGRLVLEGGACRFAEPPSPAERARRDAYFRRSRRRATLRWLKYMITFEDWVEYIARKLERRTGRPVRLTPLERRAPLLFAWPRAIGVFVALRRARHSR